MAELPAALRNLTPFKPVASRVLQALADPNPEIHEITALIESDPALSAEMLILANSPVFRRGAEIESIAHAIAMLGFDRTRAVTSTAAMRAFVRAGPKSPALRSCWLHSVACAFISAELERVCRVDGHQAYMAGLLHDIGRLGLLAAYPDAYSRIMAGGYETVQEILAAERRAVGIDHCTAGQLLVSLWHLPRVLVDVMCTDQERACGDQGIPFLVRTACLLADALRFEAVRYESVRSFDEIRSGLPPALQERFAFSLEELEEKVIENIYQLDSL